MKIDNISHLSTPGRIDLSNNSGKAESATSSNGTESGSVTHLSQASSDTRQDIDQTRVAELCQAISEGRLTVDTGRIADRLIASVQDLLGGKP